MLRITWLSRLIVAVCCLPGMAATQEATECATCHEDQVKAISGPHQSVPCATCHSGYTEIPHPDGLPKPECATCHEVADLRTRASVHGRARAAGNEAAPDCAFCHGNAHQVVRTGTQEFRQSIPELCGACHAEPLTEFSESVHGKAVRQGIVAAPVCSSCHGEHLVLETQQEGSRVSAAQIPETCGSCHADVRLTDQFQLPRDVVASFESSFHGLALRGGEQTVAHCASCHGVHKILPSSDPQSMVNPANLSQTCGSCHPGAGTTFAIGNVHWSPGEGEPTPVRWVRLAYYLLIPLLIGLMFIHSLADWIRKLITRRLRLRGAPDFNPGPEMAARRHPATFRMYRAERIQHVLLMISFAVLVWSGFALTYPDHWWAQPLLASPGLRATVHRVAGAVLLAVALAHVITLLVSRELRRHWKLLLPAPGDASQAASNFRWLLGLRKEPPAMSSHSYVEKAEYWAVIWGTGLMALTGIVLWANDFFLRHVPRVILDIATAIHFYEAVLASLAIVIWHFYYVIFDPEVYPMDPAWISGYSVRPRPYDEEVEQAVHADAPSEVTDDKPTEPPDEETAAEPPQQS